MQNGLSDGVLTRGLLAHGVQTPASDYDSQPSESLQTSFKNQQFYRYHVNKHLPISPASTVSDRSDHSEQSNTSDVPSQSSQSSLSEQSTGSRDASPFSSPLAPKNQHSRSRLARCVSSSQFSESSADLEYQSGCEQYEATAIKSQGAESNRHKTAYTSVPAHIASWNEATYLPYRSRPEHASNPCQATTYGPNNTERVVIQPKESSDVTVESSCSDDSTKVTASRCFAGLVNPFSNVPSSQSSATGCSQNQQTNSRRRSVASTVPPPKLRRDTDNTDAIVKMIVIFCTNLIQSIWPVDNVVACNATSPSGGNVLPLQVFITETLRRSKTSYSTLQIALFYLILLRQCIPELSQPGQRNQSGCRAMLCGRRMFLTALILASKYLQDRNYSARAWSKISGLPMKEINDNERRYLRFVGWDLHVPKEAFENWSKIVLAICRLSTGQDPAGKDFDHQPPSPGFGPIGQTSTKSQLQDMCPGEQLHIVRSWWIFNLHGLCTDVVRCPKKTDHYVSSIPQLKTTPALPRPLFEAKSLEQSFIYPREQDEAARITKLSRPSSLECLQKTPIPASSNTPMSSRIMPPPPPALGTLPTPQSTPRFNVAGSWKPMLPGSGSRCQDAMSLLRSLDRPCSMANTEKFPVSRCALQLPTPLRSAVTSQDCKPSLLQPSPSAWSSSSYKARQILQVTDHSLTSSPESVVSDLSCFSGLAGRSRTSSFSSTSSLSLTSQSNMMMSEAERCEGFKKQLNSLDAEIAPRLHDWTTTALQAGVDRQEISRPQTAFRTSAPRSDCDAEQNSQTNDTDSESILDEGYWSGDYSSKKEEKRKQAIALSTRVQQNAESTMNLLKQMESRPTLSRPTITRSTTQIYRPVGQSSNMSQQTLKRSRSESFDKGAEPYLSDSNPCITTFGPAKNVQQSWQPWAASKQPIQCRVQDANKRLAVQSAAATQASLDLKINGNRLDYHSRAHQGSRTSNTETDFGTGSLWQQCPLHLQEIHV